MPAASALASGLASRARRGCGAPYVCSRLERLFPADERSQALVLFATGGAAGKVGAQAGDHRVGVLARELELDVAVELVEALVAADLRTCRPQESAQRLLQIGSLHH